MQVRGRSSAAGVLTVGVKHVAGEPHLWRTEGVIGGEAEDGWKHSAFEARVLRTPETHTGSTREIQRARNQRASEELGEHAC